MSHTHLYLLYVYLQALEWSKDVSAMQQLSFHKKNISISMKSKIYCISLQRYYSKHYISFLKHVWLLYNPLIYEWELDLSGFIFNKSS